MVKNNIQFYSSETHKNQWFLDKIYFNISPWLMKILNFRALKCTRMNVFWVKYTSIHYHGWRKFSIFLTAETFQNKEFRKTSTSIDSDSQFLSNFRRILDDWKILRNWLSFLRILHNPTNNDGQSMVHFPRSCRRNVSLQPDEFSSRLWEPDS